MLAARRLHEALLELRYSPDQPRAPAGTPEGGQWIYAGGGSAESSSGHLLVADNRSENAYVKYVAKKLQLTVDDADRLHRIISKMGYTKEEIMNIAIDYFAK